MNKTQIIINLERDIKELREQLIETRDERDELHSEYDAMRARVAERDATIAKLAHSFNEANADNDELQHALDEATEKIRTLQQAFAKPAEVLDLEALGYDGITMRDVAVGDVITPSYDHTEQYRVTAVHRVIEDFDASEKLIMVDVVRPDGTDAAYTEFDGSWVVWHCFAAKPIPGPFREADVDLERLLDEESAVMIAYTTATATFWIVVGIVVFIIRVIRERRS